MRRLPAPENPRRHRRSAVLAAIARREWLLQMLALTAAGCRRSPPRSASSVTLAESDLPPLMPSHDNWAIHLVFLPLLTLNAQGELEPQLAQSWEHSADYRDWTYHLRPGVRWHDGVPVTAGDVKFTLDLLCQQLALGYSPDSFEAITVVDPATIRIRSRHARQPDTYRVYYPKHLVERLDPAKLDQWDFWNHPVGNGPVALFDTSRRR